MRSGYNVLHCPPSGSPCLALSLMLQQYVNYFLHPTASHLTDLQPIHEPSSPMDDAMDVDTSYVVEPVAAPISFSPVPLSAAPTVTDFNQLFYDTMSPPRSFESPVRTPSKNRPSLSPESTRAPKHGD